MRTNTETSIAIYQIRLRILITLKTSPIFTTNRQLSPQMLLHLGRSRSHLTHGSLARYHPGPYDNQQLNQFTILKLMVVANTQTHRPRYVCNIRPHLCTTYTPCDLNDTENLNIEDWGGCKEPCVRWGRGCPHNMANLRNVKFPARCKAVHILKLIR